MLYDKYCLHYDFLKIYLQKIQIEFFFYSLRFQVGSLKECIYACLSMQIHKNMFISIAAHLAHFFLIFHDFETDQ